MSLADALDELREELSTRMQDRWGGALASLVARTADVLAMYKAHIGNGGGVWHASADTANDLLAIAPVTRAQCYALLNRLRTSIPDHFAETGPVHLIADATNVVTQPEADSNASGVALANELADILDAHRVEAGVHVLDDIVNAITSDAAHAGELGDSGGSRPVEIGDRHLPENSHGHPYVVLTAGGSSSEGPRDMSTNPKILSTDLWLCEAHCWVAEAESEADVRVRDVERFRQLGDMLQDLKRAVYALQHGTLRVRTEQFGDISMVRDIELMRYGEEGIAIFTVAVPCPEGPTYLTALGTALPAIPGGLAVNPPLS
jgi:hypothetical protein